MSDSTIDDALKLLETGKGNPDRLKKIIGNFQEKSLISIADRKYVEALVTQYLSPRQRVKIKKNDPKKENLGNLPRIRKADRVKFLNERKHTENIVKEKYESQTLDQKNLKLCSKCGTKNSSVNNFCDNCGSNIISIKSDAKIDTPISNERKETTFEEYEKEYLDRVTGEDNDLIEKNISLEEKFVTQIEQGVTKKKKSSSGKKTAIIGIIAIIVIGGAAALTLDFDISTNTTVLERATCDNKTILVSSTKVPGFPDPEKDLQHYLDRYNNEPNYADWFDRNFPGMTMEEVLVKQKSTSSTKVPGFPDPEKDLQHYLDRYNNEPNYADWFDRNFPGMTMEEVLVKQKSTSSTKVPGFPDPEKDLQHYLDRYNNEPNYADWFDRNFPGMTMEEAVC